MFVAFASVSGLFLFLILLFICWPLLNPARREDKHSTLMRDLRAAHFERLRLLENLQDLETDRSFGKIADEDYQDLKSDLTSQLGQFYERIDELEKSPLISGFLAELQRQRKSK